MIKFVLLDIDDTLLDFGKAEYAAIFRTFTELGLNPTDEMIHRYSEINDEQWKLLEQGKIERNAALVRRFGLLFEEYGVTASPEKAQDRYEYLLGIGHWFIDGAPELLAALYGKYKLYIVSNGTATVQDSRIESAAIGKYFEDIFISERMGADKPSKEFFDLCFERIADFNKDEAIILGDRLSSDILGGINAGVRTCWFNPNALPADPDIRPDFEIRALSEFPPLLENI